MIPVPVRRYSASGLAYGSLHRRARRVRKTAPFDTPRPFDFAQGGPDPLAHVFNIE